MNNFIEWDFGKDKELADRLLKLVLEEKKTATAGLFISEDELSKVGDYAYILDSEGNRVCKIQYTNIEVNLS